MGLTKATPTSVFNGQSFLIVFDEVSDYSTATVDSITANGLDLGQIFEGSTTWNGDDPSFEDILDEQGDIIVSTAKAGTFGFDFEMADFSAAKMKTFLKAKEKGSDTTTASVFGTGATAVGTDGDVPVITRPIAIINDEQNKAIFLPKARILTGPNMENKLFVLKSIAKAQDCNTEKLGTFMLIDKVKLGTTSAAQGA